MVGIFAFFVIRTYVWQYDAMLNGVDAEAHGSWIDHAVRVARDGSEFPMTTYYVSFQRSDGSVTEARLLNPNGTLWLDSCVRIRYIPGRDHVATLMQTKD